MKRLAIITTHPVQYNAPLFRMIAERGKVQVKVFYTKAKAHSPAYYDPGFQREINWDIPLLNGYDHEFVGATVSKSKLIMGKFVLSRVLDFRPDAALVFGWNFPAHFFIMRHLPKLGVKVFFRGDSILKEQDVIWKRLFKSVFLKKLYAKVDSIFYPGKMSRLYFEKYGARDKQLVFAGHAVDNGRFAQVFSENELKDLRRCYGITDDAIVFIYVGKLIPGKNVSLIIKAFSSLNRPDSCLLIVGDGAERKTLEKIAPSNVIFTGFINQKAMPVHYAISDVLVLVSIETWGLVVNEAMAAGLALIAGNEVGCVPDLIKDGDNGFIVESSVESVRVAMQKLVDKDLIRQFSGRSIDKVSSWNFTAVCEAIEARINAINED